MKPIFLCGFMGCGKSTIGKILAEKLRLDFVDADNYIENQAGKTIPQIFKEKGEKFFRDLEYQSAIDLAYKNNVIVATGGGMMTFSRCWESINSLAVVIYLDADFDICYNRIKDSDRPIVSSNSKESLLKLYTDRYPLYKAHSHLQCITCKAAEQTADSILISLKSWQL